MKNRSLFLILLLAVFMPWAANAQNRTLVTIGDGTSTQRYPLPGYYDYQYDVFIYTPTAAPALEADSDISSIAFNVSTNNTSGESTMKIWVKDVDATYALAAATTFDDYTADAELVYENDDFSSTTGWNTFAFTRDFSHQGGKALLVAVRGEGCGTSACSRLCTYTSVSNTTWYKHQDNTDPGTNVSGYLGSSRANIQLELTYTGAVCLTPSGLTYSNIVENAATLSWTENGEGTAWVLEYSTASDYAGATTVNVSGTPTTSLSGLSALTTYYVRVKADCGSDWLTGSFTTTAHAETVGNAWADDFEGTTCGWELINGTVTQANWFWGTAENSGSGSHSIYTTNDNGNTCSYNTSSAARVYAAKLLTFADGKYTFQFDWKCNGETTSYDYLSVGLLPATAVITADNTNSGTLPTGWISVHDATYLNGVTAWQTSPEKTVQLESGNYYLVLRWRQDGSGGTGTGAAVDNVSITRVACPYDVTGLAVSEITTNSATLSWEGGEATQWQVAYSTASNFEGATEEIVSTASYNMSGLQSSSMYYVKVRAYCGGEDFGSWSNELSFATECEAFDLALEDFSENFDGITLASAYTPSTQTLPICWSSINTTTYSSYKVYPTIYYYSYTDYSHSSPNSLRFYSSYSSYSNYDPQDEYAILPEMENLAGKQITLWIRGYNATTPFKVGLITNPADASTFVEITNDANPSLSTGYQEFNYIIPSDATANYVAIMMEAANSSNSTRGLYIDDIKIADPPTCLRPENLTFVSSTTTEATLSWTNGAEGQTAWQIAYSTDPAFNPDDVTPTNVTSNPGTISGLTAATTYYAYVRANCGNDGYSDWSIDYVQFATACEAITDFPVSYKFETSEGFPANASTPTTNQLGACWRNEATVQTGTNSTRVWGTSTSYKHEGSQALILPDKGNSSNPAKTMLVFPEMVFTSERGYTVSFWINRNNNGTNPEGFKVYISDTDTISANAVELGHYSRNYGIAYPVIESAAGWYQYEIQIPQSTMTGNVFLIFEGQSYYGSATYVDEVLVKETPTCQTPSGLAFVSSTTTSATLGWTAGGTETAWQIAYSTDPAFDPDEVTPANVTSNPGIISGLTAATTYYAYVRANCGNDDYSDWSSAYVQFDTECEVIVVDATHPFTEGFDGITSGIPVCWDNSEGTTSTESYRWNYYATGYKGHCVRFNSYNNSEDNTNFLKTPVMNLPQEGENLQLSFWYKNPAGGDFSVYISTDGGDTYTTALASDLTDQSEWTKKDISLREYAGNENVVIVFAGTSNWGYNDAYIYLDEVFVGMPFTKEIDAYDEANEKGWYLIASPLADAVDLDDVDGLTNQTFRLYRFNQSAELEWEYYNGSNNPFTSLVNGTGYLYANSEDVTLTFVGAPIDGDSYDVTLQNNADAPSLGGWNLVGNPFGATAYITGEFSFYTLDNGSEVVPNNSFTSIEPMEAVFVYTEEDGVTLTFTTSEPNSAPGKGGNLALNVSHNRGNVIDRAIVNFGEGGTLPKFQLNPNHTKVYIPQDNKDYAIVTADNQGSMPVNFKAEHNGTYTLSFGSEEVSFNYLHLIDNLTGAEVDLLQTPSYTFNATTTDYESRFKLVFCTGVNDDSDSFAFCSNGNWIINNDGEAILQVIDVTGRILSSETVNGSVSKAIHAAPGVYMLRLINGDNVKVQKIVVR